MQSILLGERVSGYHPCVLHLKALGESHKIKWIHIIPNFPPSVLVKTKPVNKTSFYLYYQYHNFFS